MKAELVPHSPNFYIMLILNFKPNYSNMSIRDRKDEFLHKTRKSDSSFRLRHDTKHIEQGENVKFILNFLKKVEEINNQFAFVNKGIADVIKIQNAILEFNETDESTVVDIDL
ncbi:UNVERIFIED_CONTAM: hypothetical protein NCL1_32685 [Trichonephila clavipes]